MVIREFRSGGIHPLLISTIPIEIVGYPCPKSSKSIEIVEYVRGYSTMSRGIVEYERALGLSCFWNSLSQNAQVVVA